MNENTETALLSFILSLFVFVAFAYIYGYASFALLGNVNYVITFICSFVFSMFFGIFYYYDETHYIKHEYTYKENREGLK